MVASFISAELLSTVTWLQHRHSARKRGIRHALDIYSDYKSRLRGLGKACIT